MVTNPTKENIYKFPILVISVAVLVSAAIAYLLWNPVVGSLKKSTAELRYKKAELKAVETDLKNLKALEGKKEYIKVQNEKLLAALPRDRDIPRLFVQFENVARASGIAISKAGEATNQDSSASTGTIAGFTYDLSGYASGYTTFKNLFTNMENALRLSGITKFNVSKTGETLNVELSLNTYARKESE